MTPPCGPPAPAGISISAPLLGFAPLNVADDEPSGGSEASSSGYHTTRAPVAVPTRSLVIFTNVCQGPLDGVTTGAA